MKFLHAIMFFCLSSAVCAEAADVLEVSGHVGGEVSVHCSGSWTPNNSAEHTKLYFCKGVCSGGNVLIEMKKPRSAVARQGRYRMEVDRGYGVFDVTIEKLKRADAGRYHCGVEKTFNVLYQEVNLRVLVASTVPPRSLPSTTTTTTTTTLEAEAVTLSRTASLSLAASTTSTSEEKTPQEKASKLTDTTLVIIVSASLALMVCAIIPLIFYGRWRSNAEYQNSPEENKGEGDYCVQNADVASTQVEVRLQTFDPEADPESSVQDTLQHAAVY